MKLSKKINPVILMILLTTSVIIVLAETNIASSQSTSQSTIVSTELINFYGMSSSEVENFVETIDDQGIPILTIRLNAMSEFQSGTSSGISKAKQVIQEANSRGIEVCVDLHTWYTTWDNYFRDSASSSGTRRSQYITYVRNVISAFDGSNVYAFMVMNEPQARTASNSENQFILDVIAAAKQETNQPISVRFMAGYSPSTGHYSTQIDRESDFLCRNTYWDPRNPSSTVYGTTQSKLLNAIDAAHSQDKSLWITEFGKTKSNLEEQRRYVEAFVEWSKSNGVDAVFCWVCQPEGGSGESYNIFNTYSPNPAFYELVNDGTLPTPTPTPQPTSTPSPSPNPTPTPDPISPESSATLVDDGFEFRFDAWSSTSSTRGETADVAAGAACEGSYGARFTSDGDGGYEKTYAYLDVSENEVYVKAHFRITQSGMQQNDDRVKLVELRAGNRIVGAAGIWLNGGELYWWMETRDGSAYVETFTEAVELDVSSWFSLQFGWVSDSGDGGGRLWVNDRLVYEVDGADTNNYGACSEIQVGLAEAYYCGDTTLEVDCVEVSTDHIYESLAPTPTPEPTSTPSPTPTPEPSPTPAYSRRHRSYRNWR